jgi:hypothetical protein
LPTEDQSTESCYVVEPVLVRGPVCGLSHLTCYEHVPNTFKGIDHPQGMGIMVIAPCPVYWHIIIPTDFTAVPYFVLISFGKHSHVPPPPSFVSQDHVLALEEVMRPMLTPGLTRCKFFLNVFRTCF